MFLPCQTRLKFTLKQRKFITTSLQVATTICCVKHRSFIYISAYRGHYYHGRDEEALLRGLYERSSSTKYTRRVNRKQILGEMQD
jgi:hypothetical protein